MGTWQDARRIVGGCALAGALVIPLPANSQTDRVPPQPDALEGAAPYVDKSINGVTLRLHVFAPPDSAGTAVPAIVFFFGGGWSGGALDQFIPQAVHFSSLGLTSILADYRVSLRHGTTPFEAMTDAKSAIRWVRAHAGTLHIDPHRIAAAGASSGAHLALSAAVFNTLDQIGEDRTVSSKPDALILFSVVVDTAAENMRFRFGNRGREGSPLHHLHRGLPPMLFLHGTADVMAPYSAVRQFCREATALGARCELIGYEGGPHGFFTPAAGNARVYDDTLREADRFLAEIGFLSRTRNAAPRTKPHEPRTQERRTNVVPTNPL